MDDTSRMAEMCADAWRSMYAYTEAFDKQPKGSATVQVAVLDLVNWCQVAAMAERHTRTHHATLADMAKRLEAAESDSKRLDALLQAMEEVNVHEYVFVANALIEVHRRAAEILAGWMGEEGG